MILLVCDISHTNMPHVSSRELDEKNFKKIYDQLIILFDTAGNQRRSDVLLKEVLTETEKIMLAKRIAAIFLLVEGVSETFISNLLFLSSSTVAKISVKYEANLYPFISNISKKNSKTIWDIFGEYIVSSLQTKSIKRRMQWMDEVERRYNRKIFKT